MAASRRVSLRRLLIAFYIAIVLVWIHVLASFLYSTALVNDHGVPKIDNQEPIAIVVGLPKSGTTSLHSFFSCSGYFATHYCCCGSNSTQYPCTNGRQMSEKLQENLRAGRPLFEETMETHGFLGKRSGVFHTQLDGETKQDGYDYFLPQHYFLDELDEAAPHAVWILPLRPAEDWKRSVQNWLDLEHRLEREYSQRSPTQKEFNDFLVDFYRMHTELIRDYCRQRQKGACLEVEINDPAAGKLLEDFFTGTSAKCWNRQNAGAFFQAISPPS